MAFLILGLTLSNHSSFAQNLCSKSATNYVYDNDDFWSTPQTFDGDVLIPFGVTIEATSDINLCAGCNIVIETGGTLILNGATVKRACAERSWGSIYVQGSYGDPDHYLGSNPNQLVYYGRLFANDSRIEGGWVAVNMMSYDVYNDRQLSWPELHWGGYVSATNTEFIDNRKAAAFMRHKDGNQSFFRNCRFAEDGNISNTEGVTIWSTDVVFRGCKFENIDGAGILGIDNYTIFTGGEFNNCDRGYTSSGTGFNFGSHFGENNKFNNINGYAISLSSTGTPLLGSRILENEITNCGRGINVRDASSIVLSGNTINGGYFGMKFSDLQSLAQVIVECNSITSTSNARATLVEGNCNSIDFHNNLIGTSQFALYYRSMGVSTGSMLNQEHGHLFEATILPWNRSFYAVSGVQAIDYLRDENSAAESGISALGSGITLKNNVPEELTCFWTLTEDPENPDQTTEEIIEQIETAKYSKNKDQLRIAGKNAERHIKSLVQIGNFAKLSSLMSSLNDPQIDLLVRSAISNSDNLVLQNDLREYLSITNEKMSRLLRIYDDFNNAEHVPQLATDDKQWLQNHAADTAMYAGLPDYAESMLILYDLVKPYEDEIAELRIPKATIQTDFEKLELHPNLVKSGDPVKILSPFEFPTNKIMAVELATGRAVVLEINESFIDTSPLTPGLYLTISTDTTGNSSKSLLTILQ